MFLPATQHIFDKEALIKPKSQDRPKLFNLFVAKITEFALIGIFVLQFVNLILLWPYSLLTVVTFIMKYLTIPNIIYFPEGRCRADHLDIELDQAPPALRELQQLKQYNMFTLAQKIQHWLIVGLSLGSVITNFTSIASFFHLLPTSNLT